MWGVGNWELGIGNWVLGIGYCLLVRPEPVEGSPCPPCLPLHPTPYTLPKPHTPNPTPHPTP
ncbi:MAG: hypothetical protein F6J93_01105 [Oscillatoria sp. SIO1A7]|nr:hypothetical protein [Oscillatoria sp. SIO1A7]